LAPSHQLERLFKDPIPLPHSQPPHPPIEFLFPCFLNSINGKSTSCTHPARLGTNQLQCPSTTSTVSSWQRRWDHHPSLPPSRQFIASGYRCSHASHLDVQPYPQFRRWYFRRRSRLNDPIPSSQLEAHRNNR
jgi:hypothetical protein